MLNSRRCLRPQLLKDLQREERQVYRKGKSIEEARNQLLFQLTSFCKFSSDKTNRNITLSLYKATLLFQNLLFFNSSEARWRCLKPQLLKDLQKEKKQVLKKQGNNYCSNLPIFELYCSPTNQIRKFFLFCMTHLYNVFSKLVIS